MWNPFCEQAQRVRFYQRAGCHGILIVTPAEAGVQKGREGLDSGFRRNDGKRCSLTYEVFASWRDFAG